MLERRPRVIISPFSGAKFSCKVGQYWSYNTFKPTLLDDKPDHIILHIRTNDLRSEKTSSQISKSLTELAMSLKSDENSIIVSSTVKQFDNLHKVNEIKNRLVPVCGKRDIHSETIDLS